MWGSRPDVQQTALDIHNRSLLDLDSMEPLIEAQDTDGQSGPN